LYPRFRSTTNRKEGEEGAKDGGAEEFRLDVVVAASGFKHSEQKMLEEYMEAVRGDEDLEVSHSDEGEGEDLSTDDEAITSERDVMEERVGPGPDTSAEDHGLDATARESNSNHGGREGTVIIRPSSVDEPLEESARSSTGSGVPSVARSVSVETGLRNLKVLEGDIPEKGDLDRGGKVEAADLEGDQDLDDDSTDDEEDTERRVTSSRIQERVAIEITRDKNRQRKYHTKKSAQRSKGGRVKGSKARNSVKQQVASAEWF